MPIQNTQILFEYDDPTLRTGMTNYCAGVWRLPIKQIVTGVTDDHAVTGYYEYQNVVPWFIKSLKVDGVLYPKFDTLAECITTDSSFFFDATNSIVYIYIANGDPPLAKEFYLGYAIGFSLNAQDPYFNGWYYDSRLLSVQSVKKSIDPLFYGLLKYQAGKVTLINTDGEFDDWRSRNLFGQATRILVGDIGDTYADFDLVHTGFIENDTRDFEKLSITLQDTRKALTQAVATNTFTSTEYPNIADSNIGKVKPVAYGKILDAKCVCVNEDGSAPFIFYVCDPTVQPYSSIDAIYINGIPISLPEESETPASGIFTIAGTKANANGDTIADNLSAVTCDFTVTLTNGVEIIKDLMLKFDGRTYISSFWDTTEVALASASALDTSLYVDSSSKKLSECISSVCNDISARFFTHDDGLYTIRLYDANRAVSKTIEKDEWLDEPDFENNGSEYLSSATVKYNHKLSSDTWSEYTDTSYYDLAFALYKKAKTETFETNLTTLADATAKANVIMSQSYNVQDLVSRTTGWTHRDIEICDFIVCDPISRVNGAETKACYEVMSITKDPEKLTVQLILRYVKADPTVYYDYDALVTLASVEFVTLAGIGIHAKQVRI